MKEWQNSILTGDCLEVLSELPDDSVHICMTSPPYWGLRDYNHEDQLGLESESKDYVQNIADVMDKVKRVLRADGSLWLNLGDTYSNKDLQQIPARIALELQQRDWMLRNRVTWAKPNPMPQSVKDRLNGTTEAIFHLVKQNDYWYDLDAVREPHAEASKERGKRPFSANIERDGMTDRESMSEANAPQTGQMNHPAGKNPGDVFEVTTKPFSDAHFAVYPEALCEKPIKATAPPKTCADCGAPYERDVEREKITDNPRSADAQYQQNSGHMRNDHDRQLGGRYQKMLQERDVEFNGWDKTCDCDTDATEPGIVLDPFAGAGTTLLKAKDLNRKFIGIELNPKYADMARGRIGLSLNDPSNVRDADAQAGLESYGGGDDG